MRHDQTSARPSRLRYGHLAVALVLGMTSLSGAAQAACGITSDADMVDNFMSDPRDILRVSPRGGRSLTNQIRVLAVAGIGPLKAIGTVITQANPQQKDAIGTGLAHAGGACSARSPDIARRIGDLVRSNGDREVFRAYTRFLTDSDSRPAPDPSTSTGKPEVSTTRGNTEPTGRSSIRPLPLGDPFAKP